MKTCACTAGLMRKVLRNCTLRKNSTDTAGGVAVAAQELETRVCWAPPPTLTKAGNYKYENLSKYCFEIAIEQVLWNYRRYLICSSYWISSWIGPNDGSCSRMVGTCRSLLQINSDSYEKQPCIHSKIRITQVLITNNATGVIQLCCEQSNSSWNVKPSLPAC